MSEGNKIHFGYFSAKYLPTLKPLVDHVRYDPDHLELVSRKRNALRREEAKRLRCVEVM
jgi:hypothetical protein